ncbi:MAG: hypothetical protein LBU13_02395 [Synergistaceae bacterium]|jgi:hypothetical protein|nr:hypothetical protein [Synergistaceae bacterium]
MLFSEVYGSYFNVLAVILKESVAGTLTRSRLIEIASEKAFAESAIRIQEALETGEWPLLDGHLRTPIKNVPTMPLTTLQKRWLKALTLDPRIRLFDPPMAGLEGVEPLYSPETFEYFDRYTDGDPFGDVGYIERFRTILTAFREKKKLKIGFKAHTGKTHSWVCTPRKLEYSPKDDKFRLIVGTAPNPSAINLARVTWCELGNPFPEEGRREAEQIKEFLVLELVDERNALERVMLHFSHLEKETVRLNENHYRITLFYEPDDETEMLIRVLSFGPMLRVTAPERFIALIRERLRKQKIFS